MLQLLLVLVLALALVLVLALGDEVCVGHAAHQLRKRYVICNSMHVVCCTAASCSTTGCVIMVPAYPRWPWQVQPMHRAPPSLILVQ